MHQWRSQNINKFHRHIPVGSGYKEKALVFHRTNPYKKLYTFKWKPQFGNPAETIFEKLLIPMATPTDPPNKNKKKFTLIQLRDSHLCIHLCKIWEVKWMEVCPRKNKEGGWLIIAKALYNFTLINYTWFYESFTYSPLS